MTAALSEPRHTAREAAAAWQFLHDLFRTPSPTQWSWLHEDSVKAAWGMLSEACGLQPSDILPLELTFREYEQTFLATFEVGFPVATCPLIETHWNKRGPVTGTLHENILFYKQFGLQIRSEGRESGDHVLFQTEFMHYLHTLEDESLSDPARHEDASQIRQAERDFLERHLAHWVPLAARHIESSMPQTWPARWMRLLANVATLTCQQFSAEAVGS